MWQNKNTKDYYDRADVETISEWINEEKYTRVLLIGLVLYEIMRVSILSLIVMTSVVFVGGVTHIVTRWEFQYQIFGEKIMIYPFTPSGYTFEELTIFWLLFTIALSILVFEHYVEVLSGTNRPLTHVNIHIVYYILVTGAHLQSLIRGNGLHDTSKFEPFREELISNDIEIENLIYLFVKKKEFGHV